MKAIELTDEQYEALMNGQSVTIEPPKPKPNKWEPEQELLVEYCNEKWLHDRLLAWRAEHDGVCGERTYAVYYDPNTQRGTAYRPGYPDLGSVLMSESATKKLVEYINDGLFDLEPPQ